MSSKTLLLLALIVAVVYILMVPPAKVQEQTGTSAEYYTPDPSYTADTITVVTPDELDRIIRLTQAALSQKIGQCTYCIETTNITLSGNTYSGVFLFSVLTGYPYGISVASTVEKGATGGPETVTSVTIQNETTVDQMDAFDTFVSGSEIEGTTTLPTIADLQSALNNT
jgi:hypothetical protein